MEVDFSALDKLKEEKPFTCQLCGKTDKTVDMFIGGYLMYTHESCGEIAEKAVDLWLESLCTREYSMFLLADNLLKAHHRVHTSNRTTRDE